MSQKLEVAEKSRTNVALDRRPSASIHGIPIHTTSGKPKDPVDLLEKVVMKRFPPVKLLSSRCSKDDFLVYCVVAHHITEGHGPIREARQAAINEMLNLLAQSRADSGYSSENVTSAVLPASKEAEEDEDPANESSTSSRKKSAKSGIALLRALAEERFPPVKYQVVRVSRSSSEPVYLTRCIVKHMVTYGEGFGPDAKAIAREAAAKTMLNRMKAFSPAGTDDVDFALLNSAFVRAVVAGSEASRNVEKDRRTVKSALIPLIRMMARADMFFRDHFMKPVFAGCFGDQIAVQYGNDYEVYLVFWHSMNLRPTKDGSLRFARRDKFSLAMKQMNFIGKRFSVSPDNMLMWFTGLMKFVVQRFRSSKDVRLVLETRNHQLVLRIESAEDHEVTVKIRPAFMFRYLTRMPGCGLNLKQVEPAREWFAVLDIVPEKRTSRKPPKCRWVYTAPETELAVFHDTKCCKPLLRMFLGLNENLRWELPVQVLKNLFMDEVLLHKGLEFWMAGDSASVAMFMFSKLEACIVAQQYPSFWQPRLNSLTVRDPGRIIADIDALRFHVCRAYRALFKLYSENARGSSVNKKRLEILDSVRCLLVEPDRFLTMNKSSAKLRGPRKTPFRVMRKQPRYKKRTGSVKTERENCDSTETKVKEVMQES